MKDREAIARAYCKWSNVDPDMVFAVNEDMTEAAIPAWQQRTALGMADAIINGLADAGLTIASVASLTRAEEEREEALAAIEPFIRHGRALDGERNLRIWTDRGYREVPREDFDRIAALKVRLIEVETHSRDGALEDFERHMKESAARRTFEAMREHGGFKYERREPEDKDDPMAEVEYVARMAVIMPEAHNYFDDQLEAARQEGREQIIDEIKRQQAIYENQGGRGSIGMVVLRGVISDIREKEYRERQRKASQPTVSSTATHKEDDAHG